MTVLSSALGLLLGLPRRDGPVRRVERDLPVVADGGTVLLTDHHAPARDRPDRPVVLIRSPYGREPADPFARLFAERGHHVVVQSCRGTFGSGGELGPFHHEVEDGRAALDWVRTQSWGRSGVAVLGASYFGYTALAVVAGAPEGAVVASARGVTAADFRRAVIWPQRAFGLGTGLTWIVSLRNQEQPRKVLRRLRRRLPVIVHDAARLPPEQADSAAGAPWSAYQDWYAHGPDDPWWDSIDLRAALDRLPPEVQVAGWCDLFLDEQLVDHAALRAAGKPVRLVVGPWTHGSLGLQRALLRESVARFAGAPAEGVRVRIGGTRRWRELPSWPPATVDARWTFGADASLVPSPLPAVGGELAFDVDPADPAPAAGGRSLLPADAGRRNQRVRERRDDVLVLTSRPRRRALDIAGRPVAELQVPDGAAGDWVVRLCDVDRSGVSRNVCEGLLRVPAVGAGDVVRVELAPTAHRFRPGHRIRLQVSAALHPTWAADPADTARRRVVVSTADRPSRLHLPVVASWHREPGVNGPVGTG